MKSSKQKAVVLLAGLMLTVSLTACGGKAPVTVPEEKAVEVTTEKTEAAESEKATEPETKDKQLVVGYSLFDFSNPYFINVTKGMEEVCKKENIQLITHDAKSDVAAQVSAVEGFIAQGVDAIVISPLDVVALEPTVSMAIEAGIPVINLNQKVNGVSAHIGMSEYEFGFTGGKIAGEWIKANLTEPAKVAVLGYPDLASLVERADGLKDGLLSLAEDAEFVNEQKAGTPEQGMAVAETILQATPDVNVLICINDAGALGAYEAFAAAGKDKENMCIVGLDATDEAISKIKEGGMYVGTVDIDGYGTGVLGIETVLKVMAEGAIEEMIEIDCVPVTGDNVDTYK